MAEPPPAAAWGNGREGGLPPPGGSGRSEYDYEYNFPLDALVEAAESVGRESAPAGASPPQFGIEPIDTVDPLPAATGPSGETWEVVRQAQGKVTIARARPLCLHPTAHHHNPCAPWLKVAKETLAEPADGKCFALLDRNVVSNPWRKVWVVRHAPATADEPAHFKCYFEESGDVIDEPENGVVKAIHCGLAC